MLKVGIKAKKLKKIHSKAFNETPISSESCSKLLAEQIEAQKSRFVEKTFERSFF